MVKRESLTLAGRFKGSNPLCFAHLSQQLNWRNGAAGVLLRQVDVVDEDDALLAHRRSEDTLATPVQLRHDHLLGVVDVRPGRKVNHVGHELLLGQPPDEAVGDEGLSGAAGSDYAEREALGERQVQEEGLLDGLGCRHDEALFLGGVLKQSHYTMSHIVTQCLTTLYGITLHYMMSHYDLIQGDILFFKYNCQPRGYISEG